MKRDMDDGAKKIVLDLITDPEEGIALLSKDPPDETPEQRRLRKFWLFQFECWRNWQAGDSTAFVRAVIHCRAEHQPPLRWLCNASLEFLEQGISRLEQKGQTAFLMHHARWTAVSAMKRRIAELRKKFPRRADTSRQNPFEQAAEIRERAGDTVTANTIETSYQLIEDAGGPAATFKSYRHSAKKFNRHRR